MKNLEKTITILFDFKNLFILESEMLESIRNSISCLAGKCFRNRSEKTFQSC